MICGDARRAAAAVIAIAAAAAAGCSSSGETETDAADGTCLACDAGEPDALARCDRTEDCGDGLMCVDGMCVTTVFGNGKIEPGEQCDDSNVAEFDGCDPEGRYELFMRTYETNVMPSPAGSFCSSPKSALGDALSAFALATDNADRKARIDMGLDNSLLQFVGLRDLTGRENGTLEIRRVNAVLDPARGEWPVSSDGLDWWFLLRPSGLTPDGAIADRIGDVALTDGTFVGGPSVNEQTIPEFLDAAVRARFDDSDPDRPPPPPDELADGLVAARGLIADGSDEGFCGDVPVASLARTPAAPTVTNCLECPEFSHAYVPCDGPEVGDGCNSVLDVIVGGCLVGEDCLSGRLVFPTQPDVMRGGPEPLVPDPENVHKIPTAQTDRNMNGYSVYLKFRAKRVHVTGIAE
jgi:cysteine-rich repeat protein